MRDADGLRLLQVRVGGHDGVVMSFCLLQKRGAEFDDCGACGGGMVAEEEAKIGRDLLVAAASGMELEGSVSDEGGEGALDVVVHVFAFRIADRQRCRALDRVESLDDGCSFIGAKHPDLLECERIGATGREFVGQQALIEIKRPLPILELMVYRAVETA